MSRNLPLRIVKIISMVTLLLSLCVLFAVRATEQSRDQMDWKQWTAKDVHTVLTKSPWVSTCCQDWNGAANSSSGKGDPTASIGYSACIVSSKLIRQALVRRLQLDKRYAMLDLIQRADVDQRIAACLSERFNEYVIMSFSFNIGPDPKLALAKANEIHLLLPDGRKIAGQVAGDSVTRKCGGLQENVNQYPVVGSFSDLGLYGPNGELAFPRVVNGKPTIGRDDKKIRVELDFSAAKSWPGHSRPEIDFSIDKLIYQGKPDF